MPGVPIASPPLKNQPLMNREGIFREWKVNHGSHPSRTLISDEDGMGTVPAETTAALVGEPEAARSPTGMNGSDQARDIAG